MSEHACVDCLLDGLRNGEFEPWLAARPLGNKEAVAVFAQNLCNIEERFAALGRRDVADIFHFAKYGLATALAKRLREKDNGADGDFEIGADRTFSKSLADQVREEVQKLAVLGLAHSAAAPLAPSPVSPATAELVFGPVGPPTPSEIRKSPRKSPKARKRSAKKKASILRKAK